MANKSIFRSPPSVKAPPVADTVNNAGGKAYKTGDKHKLAQIAATNCFNGTFYASAKDTLKLAKDAALALQGDPEFIAKVAIYSRTRAYMKDMPAFLAVVLSEIDKPLFRKVFRKVVNNGKMLRNVIQMARSGAITGKPKNMSSHAYRKAVQEWFDSKSPWALLKAGIGNNPSMKEIIRMCRPKANTPEKNAMFAYFLERDVELSALPQIVREFEAFKKSPKTSKVPDLDFRLLDSAGLSDEQWTEIARNAPWMMTRMNLNTFARHGVFKNKDVAKMVADRLRDRELIADAGAFPYQLFSTWRACKENTEIPYDIKDAIQDAAEIAIDNVPVIDGKVFVAVDTSGSMDSPITGGDNDKKPASKARCVDVAGLIASAIARKNRSATIMTFNTRAVTVDINPRDTVFTNTEKLNKAGGGTAVSVALRDLNAQKAEGDVVIYVSDYESWFDSYYQRSGTAMQAEWDIFKKRNPKAKLVCIDLTPKDNGQVKCRKDVLQVGGFSDQVFNVVANFVKYGNEADHWVSEIEAISLDDIVEAEVEEESEDE